MSHKIEIGQKLISPTQFGDQYHDEVVEILPNLIAVKSLDYPTHGITWWKIEDFKNHYHKDGTEKHDCKCWD